MAFGGGAVEILWKWEEGFDLRQSAYAKELVEKWGVGEKMEVPMFKAPEEEEEPHDASTGTGADGRVAMAGNEDEAGFDGGSRNNGPEHEKPEAGGGCGHGVAEVCERNDRRGSQVREGY